MKQVSGKELARLIEGRGWVLARINGSHHIFVTECRRERIVILNHGNRLLKLGLLRSLMKIADLSEAEL